MFRALRSALSRSVVSDGYVFRMRQVVSKLGIQSRPRHIFRSLIDKLVAAAQLRQAY